jgi:glycerol-3-phosphate dehydrogenase (NAD+)
MRIGLLEIKKFAERFFSGAAKCSVALMSQGIKMETFLESCGLADMITTSFYGRNHKCAVAFVKTGKVLIV